jgi:hypothetical protein
VTSSRSGWNGRLLTLTAWAGRAGSRVEASLAGRLFETFLLDVGEWDGPTIGQPEALTTPDLLGFAGIEPVTVAAIPLTRQVAEKLHAYTRRYEGAGSAADRKTWSIWR